MSLVFFSSCNKGRESHLFKSGANVWRVIQLTKGGNNSSPIFLKFKSNNTYEELEYVNNEFKQINSNPDIKDYHKWEMVNDSIIKIAFIPFKIIFLNDSIGKFLNVRRPQDTLLIKNYKILPTGAGQ